MAIAVMVPHLEKIHQAMREKGVEVLAVDFQDTLEKIVPHLEQKVKCSYRFLKAEDKEGGVEQLYHVKGLPINYVIGRDGGILWSQAGFGGDAPLRQAREKAMEKP